ncbi:archaellin/type IV pilin N-terminal domain-containing protein [Halorubrum tibetense]|uniref:Flagellin n=1 Tax=Halorubrum tibetense TaxID=175631 RepID=A0ABD5SG17_9EURY
MFEFINNSEERGQVGIGTLIVFIAMVLVAAIAAGVLINTAGFLQSQAEATGEESTDLVSERIDVTSSVGIVAGDEETLNEIRISVSGAPGADQIDLSETTIQAVGPGGQENLVFTSSTADDDVEIPDDPDQFDAPAEVGETEESITVAVSDITNDGTALIVEDGTDTEQDRVVLDSSDGDELVTLDISSADPSDGDLSVELVDNSDDTNIFGPETVAFVDSATVADLGPNEFAVGEDGDFESNPVLDGESYTILLNPAAGAFENTDFTNDRFGQGDTATLDIVSPSSATTQVELNAPDLFTDSGEAVRL